MRTTRGNRSCEAAAVLLEVILALVLFVSAAAVIGSGLGSSVEGVERQRLNTHAMNLALSVLAELQLGIRGSESGPEAFVAPFEHWTWEMQLTPVESEVGEGTKLSLAEVIIRHDDPPVVHRLSQVMEVDLARRSPAASGGGGSSIAGGGPGRTGGAP